MKKNELRSFFFLLLILFTVGNGQWAYSQTTVKAKGIVTDASTGKPVEGATVSVTSPKLTTKTNKDGAFEMSVPATVKSVKVTYIGYESIVVPISENMTATLKSSDNELSEVVVGYTTQKKKDVIGSIVTVTSKELNQRVATNPASLLQGKLPGLQVTQGSGEPGNENVQMRVRGVNTFSGAGNDPLVIIDGLPGNMSALNPNDIESISVLKDASSSAIYGSRAANGVIVVTTKKGIAGKLMVDYSYNVGISNPLKLPQTINNATQYMEMFNQARTNSGLSPVYTQSQIDLFKAGKDPLTKYANFDWLGALFQTAVTQNHYLNFRGGTDKTTYTVGAGFTTQPGTMIGFDYKKYTISLDLNSKLSKRITFGTSIQGRYGKTAAPPQGAGDMFLAGIAQTPLYPAQVDGKWIASAYNNEYHNKNPVAIANEVSKKTLDYYLQGNMFVKVNILEGLDWETRGGGNYTATNSNDFRPTINQYVLSDLKSPIGLLDVGQAGSLAISNNSNLFSSIYSQVTYNKTIGKHNLSFLGGYQEQYNINNTLNAGRIGYPTNTLSQLNAGPLNGQTNSGSANEWSIRSMYGTAKYNFADKYQVEASFRRDGTSRLPPSSRWGNFYSIAGQWRISKENFLKNVSWINDLKIRSSYGTVGNQNILNGNNQPYAYQSLLSQKDYAFGDGVAVGFSPSGLVYPNLTWETTRTVNLAVDFAGFNNRFTFTAEVYNKLTTDILRSAQVSSWIGVGAPIINNGSMRNKGFEVSTQWQDKIGDDFTYTIGGNIQGYKNTLMSYGSRVIDGNKIYEVGQPYGSYYLYKYDGIFQSQQDIDSYATQPGKTRVPGDIKLKDIADGDHKVTDHDREVVDGVYPLFQYSFNLGLKWKNIDFSAQFYGSQGSKTYVTGWGIEPFTQGGRPTTDWVNAWTPQNHSNTMPRIYSSDASLPGMNLQSTYYLKDASFMRLRGAQIGYTLPKEFIAKIGLSSIRVYAAGDNLFTITKYPGLDPERIGDGSYVTYPQVRTFTFGAAVQF